MKIVNINGRLETQGTWEETDAQAKRQADGIVQQRTELRAMLSGNVAFHVDPRATKPVKLVRLRLTDEAEAENTSFFREYRDGNCSCHISAPCGSCTHPGNPLNQAEDDTAWVVGVDLAQEGGDCTAFWQVGDRVMTAHDGPATVTRVRDENTGLLFNGIVGVKLDCNGLEGVTGTKNLRPLLTPSSAIPPAAPVKAAVKPPAVWRTADQIPQSERHGLWFYSDEYGITRTAGECLFSTSGRYIQAPAGVALGSHYRHDLYQQPDADGWFAHDPQPDSVCPVPAGVRCELRYDWYGWDSCIVAWRPVGVAT